MSITFIGASLRHLPLNCGFTVFPENRTYEFHCTKLQCLEECGNDPKFSNYTLSLLATVVSLLCILILRACVDKNTHSESSANFYHQSKWKRRMREIIVDDETKVLGLLLLALAVSLLFSLTYAKICAWFDTSCENACLLIPQ